MPQVLYSRVSKSDTYAKQVLHLDQGWQIEGDPTLYTTAKGLLAALTGHPEGRHWSLDRYFHRGAYAPTLVVEDWSFLSEPPPLILTHPELSIPHSPNSENGENRFSNRPRGPRNILGTGKTELGIDLRNRAHEVRKLLFAGFGRKMFLAGYDPEDVLQEVYRGILVRNRGSCPFDPAKSSFGHYVHMVISCVLSNYHRKQHRVTEMEQVGMINPVDEDGYRYQDVAANTTVPAKPTQVAEDSLIYEEAEDLVDYLQQDGTPDSRLAARMMPLVLQGTPREMLPLQLGVSPTAVARAFTHLRKQARYWAASN